MQRPLPAHAPPECSSVLLPMRDTLEVLAGKWKILIIMVLAVRGRTRFMDLVRELPGITPRSLSKELKELEEHQLVKRTAYATAPVTVDYELTAHGHSLRGVITALSDWGMEHRAFVLDRPLEGVLEQSWWGDCPHSGKRNGSVNGVVTEVITHG